MLLRREASCRDGSDRWTRDGLPPTVPLDEPLLPLLVGQDPAGLHAQLEAAIEATSLAAPARLGVDRARPWIAGNGVMVNGQ